MRALPYAAAGLTFAAGLAQKWPCHTAGWPYERSLMFGRMCYSDFPVLYNGRGLAEGGFPYAGRFEYPVLLGYLADVTAGLVSTPAAFFLLNAFVMLACTLVTVWATMRLTGTTWAGLIVAVSPVLALTGTINWDMLPVMFVSLAMLAWARQRPALAGLAIGLGAAAKLYPALLLFGLFLIAVREDGKRRPVLIATGFAAITWLAVNLPVMLGYPAGWMVFWQLNEQRPADFGSGYYALNLLGVAEFANLNLISIVLFGLCLAAIAAFAPRRLEVLALLTVTAFLITNKVYSPQYVLWLLPLAVVAGAPLVAIVLWQAAEIGYWWAIWSYLAAELSEPQYALLTLLRIGAELLLVLIVVLMDRKLLPGKPIGRDRHPTGAEQIQRHVSIAGGP